MSAKVAAKKYVTSSDEEDDAEYFEEDVDRLSNKWFTLDKYTLKEEEKMISQQALGPFLFGFNYVVPQFWMIALHRSGALAHDRELNNGGMTESELQIGLIVREIIKRNIKIVINPEKKPILKDVLAMINQIEKNSASTDDIDVDRSITTAIRWQFFMDAWTEIEHLPNVSKYKRETIFSLVYFFKKLQHHVSAYGSKEDTLVSYKIRLNKMNVFEEYQLHSTRNEGNQAFNDGNYQAAVDLYSEALKWDCLNVALYGNRAQAYLRMKKYWEAYCDTKRALALDEKFSKGYYRCAEACLYLGRLEEAANVNELGIKHTKKDEEQLKILHIQKEKIARRKIQLQKIAESKQNVCKVVKSCNINSKAENVPEKPLEVKNDDTSPANEENKCKGETIQEISERKVTSNCVENCHSYEAETKDIQGTPLETVTRDFESVESCQTCEIDSKGENQVNMNELQKNEETCIDSCQAESKETYPEHLSESKTTERNECIMDDQVKGHHGDNEEELMVTS